MLPRVLVEFPPEVPELRIVESVEVRVDQPSVLSPGVVPPGQNGAVPKIQKHYCFIATFANTILCVCVIYLHRFVIILYNSMCVANFRFCEIFFIIIINIQL